MGEIAAHQPAGLGAVFGAAVVIDIRDLLQAAEGHGGGEGSDNDAAIESRRQLDRWFGEGADISRDRPLHRLGCNAHIVKGIVLAVMGDASVRRP